MSDSDDLISESVVYPNTIQLETKNLKSSSIPKVVYQALDILIKDPNFIKNLETSVKNILQDGKIDQFDIPEFIFIITDAYNSMHKIRLNYDDLPVLIKLIYNYMVDKLDLIPVEQRTDFERLVDSALKLVMIQPAVARGVKLCFGKLFKCGSNAQ